MDAVALVWRAKTDSGWKYFPVIVGGNGRIKVGKVMVDGKEVCLPDGHFELRYYEGRKTKYRNVGTDATEAINERDRMRNLGDAKAFATAAGVTVNEPEVRKTIKAEAVRFVQAAEDRGAMDAAEVNRLAMTEFQKANPKMVYVDEITAQSATSFWRYLATEGKVIKKNSQVIKKEGKADRSIYNGHMRLCGFLKFAGVDYKAWGLRAPRYEKTIPNMYSKGQADQMLASCKREYNRLLITILLTTGLRDQELRHLCWSDLDLAERKLRVAGKPQYNWRIKSWEQRELPLSSELVTMLESWRKANPKTKLVLGTSNDKPNTKYLLAVKAIGKNAGVSNATLHRFRRTYGTTLLRGGMDIRTVQRLLGHGDLASTMRYLTPLLGDDAQAKFDSIY
jgi:integrase